MSWSLNGCCCSLGHLSPSEERVNVGIEELQDLKGVWAELSQIWQQIEELKEKPWLSVQPRKVIVIGHLYSREQKTNCTLNLQICFVSASFI